MSVTQNDIRKWLAEGKDEGATHMIVACDTFDWSDYPVYVKPEQDVRVEMAKYNGVNMQKIMEVYNLALPFDVQLRQTKSWNI